MTFFRGVPLKLYRKAVFTRATVLGKAVLIGLYPLRERPLAFNPEIRCPKCRDEGPTRFMLLAGVAGITVTIENPFKRGFFVAFMRHLICLLHYALFTASLTAANAVMGLINAPVAA